MKKPGIKPLIEKIAANESVDIPDRIDMALEARESIKSDDEKTNLKNDIDIFSVLIEMVKKDNDPHIYDEDLLALYSLLLDTYDQLDDYRPMKRVAYDVLELIRHEMTKWEVLNETIPEILESLGNSIYNHAIYEILLFYIRAAWKSGNLDEGMKGWARKLLKLRILLDEADYFDFRLLPNELKDALAHLFTPQELLKIILHPEIGSLKKDPVEYTWKWEDIYYDLEDKLEYRFANAPRHMGFCFKYWSTKQELLREEYGIEWRSPSLMNPHVRFD